MKSVLHIFVFFSIFLAINVSAQVYGGHPSRPVYPVHPAPGYPLPTYPVQPVRAYSPVCSAFNTCWNGAFTYTISCRANSAQSFGSFGPTCSWSTGVGFVSCTGYLPGPYGWYWGTDTRFCY